VTTPGRGKKSPDDGEVEQKPGGKKISKKVGKTKPKKQTRPKTDAERKAAKAAAAALRRANKRAQQEAEKNAEGTVEPKKLPKDPGEEVREAIPVIVNKFVEMAMAGSCQHFKSLIEQYPDAVGAEGREEQESLTELLLKEIGVEE
jgi:hypothetical protein